MILNLNFDTKDYFFIFFCILVLDSKFSVEIRLRSSTFLLKMLVASPLMFMVYFVQKQK